MLARALCVFVMVNDERSIPLHVQGKSAHRLQIYPMERRTGFERGFERGFEPELARVNDTRNEATEAW